MFEIAMQAGVMALAGWLVRQPIDQQNAERVITRVERVESQAEREVERQEREAARQDRIESRYEEGQRALEEARWQRAVEQFTLVAETKGPRSDAALYWKAYALDKLGQKADALAAAAELIKGYPKSKWMSDAKAL